jgi:hypothetical protein
VSLTVNDKEESTMKINRVGVLIWQKMFSNYMELIAGAKQSGSGGCPELNG